MSQFSIPGVQKQYKGADFRGTAGLHSKESGGVSSGVVVFSELERQQVAFQTAVDALETAYRAADTSDTQAWQAATSNISRQLNNLAQGVSNRMAVAARWEGSVAALQSAMTVSGTGVATIPQTTGGPVTIASVDADFATNEDYNTQVKAKSWESIVLIHNLTDAAETGLYCVSGGILRKFSPFFGQLRDGALIFVDAGEKANSFWTIADPTIVTANDVVIPSLIPFGSFSALQTDPLGFLTIAANQLNASLDGQYFIVVNGQLTMTPAFVARVASLESGLQTAQSNISALQSAMQSEVSSRTIADTEMQVAIDDKASTASLQAEISTRTSADSALQNAIDTKASNSALQTEISARTDADVQLGIDIAARTTAQQVQEAIANFCAYSHPVKPLMGGVFSTTGIVPTTTFYVPLADSLDWGIDRYSESASPFINVQMPTVAYVNADASGATGYFAKLEFQHDTQVPDGEVEIYLTRHYRAGETAISFF